MDDYWLKQGSKPIFNDLLWSRPENRQFAGKLLVVGGHAHGFAAPAEAFAVAEKAGIGVARVMLPDHIRPQLKKFQGSVLTTEFAPSTPSGSFSVKALAEILAAANWADGVLLAGDLGRNSETAILLERLAEKYTGPLVIAKDAVDYFTSNPLQVYDRPQTLVVLSIAQLQKFSTHAKFPVAITFNMNLLQLVEALHQMTSEHSIAIIVKHHDDLLAAQAGRVSTTKAQLDIEDAWRVPTAARAAVWWLQNQTKMFESITTALIEKA